MFRVRGLGSPYDVKVYHLSNFRENDVNVFNLVKDALAEHPITGLELPKISLIPDGRTLILTPTFGRTLNDLLKYQSHLSLEQKNALVDYNNSVIEQLKRLLYYRYNVVDFAYYTFPIYGYLEYYGRVGSKGGDGRHYAFYFRPQNFVVSPTTKHFTLIDPS